MPKKAKKSPKNYEELLPEWSEKNPDRLEDYTKGSHREALWKCPQGHEWTALVKSRYAGYGCPYCSGRLPVPGVNDLATVNPELASEWHPVLNGSRLPSDVLPFSNVKVWWICGKGHAWEATPAKRSVGKGCPYCSGKKVYDPDDYSLASAFPEIASQFDRTLNEGGPEDYTPYSNKRVWWRCDKGHSWLSAVNTRTRSERKGGCPYCSGRRVLKGFNDLETVSPSLAAEWDREKNLRGPDSVTKWSNRKVYWICPKGHSYKTEVYNRATGRGCPTCAKETSYEWKV